MRNPNILLSNPNDQSLIEWRRKLYRIGTGKVWFNDSNDNLGGWLNERVTTNLWEVQRLVQRFVAVESS